MSLEMKCDRCSSSLNSRSWFRLSYGPEIRQSIYQAELMICESCIKDVSAFLLAGKSRRRRERKRWFKAAKARQAHDYADRVAESFGWSP